VVSGGHCTVMPVMGKFKKMYTLTNASLVDAGRVGTSSDGLDIYRYYGMRNQGIVVLKIVNILMLC